MPPRRDITPIEIPHKWVNSEAVECLEGTRWYIEKGPVQHFRHWTREIHVQMAKASGGILIPLQWVPSIVGVSRESVLKRAKNGGLTVFSFVITAHTKSILGGVRPKETKNRYDLVPYSECEEWREILFEVANLVGDERLEE